jgi:MoaA/NifB/PqqE/SkfB family radical SAM enzyme
MLLKGDLSIHKRDDQYIAILADYPYWMVVNEAGKEILELCYQYPSLEEVASMFAESANFPLEESVKIVTEFLNPLKNHRLFNTDPDVNYPVDPVLIAVCINITRDCNLCCPHCYASGGTVYPDELSAEEIRTFLQGVKPYTKGTVQVQLTGGEPFLKEQKVFSAIDEFRNLDYTMLILNTNGTLLTQETVNTLVEAVSDIKYFNITVSLDGATKKTHELIRGPNTFKKVIQALKMLKEAGLSVAASIAVHQKNFHELEDIFNLCMELDVVPYTSPLAPLGRAQHSTLTQ